ncbi:MAG: nitroreductase, partial [Smithellaceae bacterium]
MNRLRVQSVVNLPAPRLAGKMSLEETLNCRKSIRDFSPEPLTIEEMSQLLWAVQGATRNGE